MTLRETINFKVLRGGNKVRTPEQVTDQIIELFEKLIDEKLHSIQEEYEEWADKPYSTKHDEVFKTDYESRIKQLQELKKELKK